MLPELPPFELNAFWISQILIGFALICDCISWQCKNRKTILVWLMGASSLIATHFWVLGETTASLIVYLSTLRFFISIFSTHRYWLYAFLAAVFLIGITTYTKTTDLLVMLASSFTTYASFQPHDKKLRQWMMVGTSLWIGYDIIIFSPGAALLESIFLISNLVGYWRFYIRR